MHDKLNADTYLNDDVVRYLIEEFILPYQPGFSAEDIDKVTTSYLKTMFAEELHPNALAETFGNSYMKLLDDCLVEIKSYGQNFIYNHPFVSEYASKVLSDLPLGEDFISKYPAGSLLNEILLAIKQTTFAYSIASSNVLVDYFSFISSNMQQSLILSEFKHPLLDVTSSRFTSRKARDLGDLVSSMYHEIMGFASLAPFLLPNSENLQWHNEITLRGSQKPFATSKAVSQWADIAKIAHSIIKYSQDETK